MSPNSNLFPFPGHLTAIDEAWDNQANFALFHVLGSSIQTALLNGPLVVIVGWGLGRGMDLSFDPFETTILILSILIIGHFLRDGKSDYLEGLLCVFVYVAVALCAFYYPEAPSGAH
jgi:Ca2+:H+ antiporter